MDGYWRCLYKHQRYWASEKFYKLLNILIKMKKFILLATILLILNLIWEFSHYPLYYDYSAVTGNTHLIIAGISDVFWIFLVFFFISLTNKNTKWIDNIKKSDYLFVIVFGLIVAVLIEIINVYFLKRWEYKESMPVLFGIGLSPLIQLSVTAITGLWIYRKVNSSAQQH